MSGMLRILAFLLIEHCYGIELKSCGSWPPDQLCKVNNNYDKNKVPGTLPLIIDPRFDILEVAEVNVIEGSISVIIFLAVNWEDQNLAYTPDQNHQKLVKYFALTKHCILKRAVSYENMIFPY